MAEHHPAKYKSLIGGRKVNKGTKRLNKAVDRILSTGHLVTGGLESLPPLAECVKSIYCNYENNYGKRTAIGLMKAHYNELTRYACKLEVKPLTKVWLKRDRDNIATTLKPFKRVLRSDNIVEVRFALSLLRTYESLQVEPLRDLGTILSPSKGSDAYSNQIRDEYLDFLNVGEFPQRLKAEFEQIRQKMQATTKFVGLSYSTKAGPKGPTCATAGKQSLCINEVFREKIGDFFELFSKRDEFYKILDYNQQHFANNKDLLDNGISKETPLGRVAFIADKGDKSRLIAIGNYWIQSGLQLVHKALYKLLSSIGEVDGTYNQTKAADRVRDSSSKRGVWSFDLTAATDRFPLLIQSDTLSFLNDKMGQTWDYIMRNCEFQSGDNRFCYKVGQPMGLYSSWASFAITHHLLVQFAAHRTGSISTFRAYSILGDDVAIWDEIVAKEYRKLINILDVSINENKSFTPDNPNEPCVAEFAKRIWNKGVEISAISPNLCLESTDIVMFGEFLAWLEQRSLIHKPIPVSRVLTFMNMSITRHPNKCKELFVLIHMTQLLRGKTYVDLTFGEEESAKINWETCKHINVSHIFKLRLYTLADQLLDTKLNEDLVEYDNEESLDTNFNKPQAPELLYFYRILQTRRYELSELYTEMCSFVPMEFYQTLDVNDLPVPSDLSKALNELEYVPKIDFESLKSGLLNRDDKKRRRGQYIIQLAALSIKLLGKEF